MKLKQHLAYLISGLFLTVSSLPVCAESLRYFTDKKTNLVGLKTRSGTILVPPQYQNFWANYEEPIGKEQREIEFIGTRRQNNADGALSFAGGDVYDRSGRYLYSPLWFDMGLDYWIEGRRRFVENGKVGFVNRAGEKVIAAQYQSVSPFWNGYAAVHEGNWQKYYSNGGDYMGIKPADKSAKTIIIDYQGNAAAGFAERQSPNDVEILGRFYPCYLPKCDPDKSFLATDAD